MIKLALTLGLCTLLLTACGDDEPMSAPIEEEPEITSFSGTLILVVDEIPLPGLEVTLFEPVSQVAIARDVTDSAGHFEFLDILPGAYIPVVHANGYIPALLVQPMWDIAEAQQVDIVLRMRRITPIDESAYTLTGLVVDKETQEPIPNARIEMNFFSRPGEITDVNWSEYRGFSTTLEATSDDDGMFFLAPLTLIGTGEVGESYIPNYRVTAAGYRSVVMDRNYDYQSINSIVAAVRLSPGEDLGNIEGYVRDPHGNPVEGVPVSVEWRRTDNMLRSFAPVDDLTGPDHILIPDGVALSDATGYYKVTGLPRGYYTVQAGIYPDDGWVGEPVGGAEIAGYNGTGEANLVVYAAITPVYPAEGAVLTGIPDRIEWEPYPDAIGYEILVRRDSDGQYTHLAVTDPEWPLHAGSNFFKHDASYSWQILALDAGKRGIGKTDRPQVFHIVHDQD